MMLTTSRAERLASHAVNATTSSMESTLNVTGKGSYGTGDNVDLEEAVDQEEAGYTM